MKIEKPNSTFVFTPLGRTVLRKFNDWWVLTRDLGQDLENDLGDMIFEVDGVFRTYPELIPLQELFMYSDIYGEGIVSINGKNTIQNSINIYINAIGGDEESFLNSLRKFKEYKWITPINI